MIINDNNIEMRRMSNVNNNNNTNKAKNDNTIKKNSKLLESYRFIMLTYRKGMLYMYFIVICII